MTFEVEGSESSGINFSRKLHVSGSISGITIGCGYDMKFKSTAKIRQELTSIGVNPDKARLLSTASGLYGNNAKLFITSNNLEGFRITQFQQVLLCFLFFNTGYFLF